MPLASSSHPTFPCKAITTHGHKPRDSLELRLRPNEHLTLLEPKGPHWFIARTSSGKRGWVPAAYVLMIQQLSSGGVGTNARGSGNSIRNVCKEWRAREDAMFADGTAAVAQVDETSFPWIPAAACACKEVACVARKKEVGLGACVHDVTKILKNLGLTRDEICRERLRWHPDVFGRRCKESWREKGKLLGQEFFVILGEALETTWDGGCDEHLYNCSDFDVDGKGNGGGVSL